MTHLDENKRIMYGWDPVYQEFFIQNIRTNRKLSYNPLVDEKTNEGLISKDSFMKELSKYKTEAFHITLIDAGIPI